MDYINGSSYILRNALNNLNKTVSSVTQKMPLNAGSGADSIKSILDPNNIAEFISKTRRDTTSPYKSGKTNSYEGLLGNGEATASDLKPDDVKNLLSCEERKLIEENNVDLTEKFDNGLPRYVFAKGKDGQYHVYDMSVDSGLAVVRTFRTGNRLCPNGSGCLRQGDGVSGDVYYIDDCNNVKEYKDCCYCTVSPLSFDTNGDGIRTSDILISYDIDGDGELDIINDSADAVLVFDKDHNGISGENGSETFGDKTDLDGDGKADGYKNGFEALKALAKKEGLINGKDDNVLDENDLKILEEKWGLGVKLNGYLGDTVSFSEAEITEIRLSDTDETTTEDNFDGNGNQLMHQEGATFVVNGETREYADIWHEKKEEDKQADIEKLKKQVAQNNDSALNFDMLDSLNPIIKKKNKKKHTPRNV